jgi:hypothetical protein
MKHTNKGKLTKHQVCDFIISIMKILIVVVVKCLVLDSLK